MSQTNHNKSSDEADQSGVDEQVADENVTAAPDAELIDENEAPAYVDEALAEMSHEELQERLSESLQQIGEMKDGYLRAKAEMENIRRRAQNEVVNARKFAIEGFAQELLNVKDSLDQAALVEMEEGAGESVEKMQEGLELTLKQLDTAMAKFSVTEVEANPGVKFNPELHQAISMVPAPDVEADHIVDVVQKGFSLKDRLLRPAMVVVSNG